MVSLQPLAVLSEVLQGPVLGPLFFLACVATCDAGISNGSKMIAFADDILRNRSVHSQDDHTELQHGVKTLVVWS